MSEIELVSWKGIGFLVGLSLAACSYSTAPQPSQDSSRVGQQGVGPVLAEVGGAQLRLSDLVGEVDSRRDRRVALQRAIDRTLLLQQASGFQAGDRSAESLRDRRAVSALLQEEVERVVGPDDVSERAVRSRYEEKRDQFVRGERRTVTHLLFSLGNGRLNERAAVAAAKAIIGEAKHGNVQGVFERASALASGAPKLEDLGTFSRQAPFVEPFLDAVFAAPGAGLVPDPVKTQYGIHVVWIRSVEPASSLSFEEARSRLANDLLTELRSRRLREFLEELRDQTEVSIDEAVWQALSSQASDLVP